MELEKFGDTRVVDIREEPDQLMMEGVRSSEDCGNAPVLPGQR